MCRRALHCFVCPVPCSVSTQCSHRTLRVAFIAVALRDVGSHGLAGAVGDMLDVAIEVLDNVAVIVANTRGVNETVANVSIAGRSAIDGIDALLARTGSS